MGAVGWGWGRLGGGGWDYPMEGKQSFGAALVPPSGENHPTQSSFKGKGSYTLIAF